MKLPHSEHAVVQETKVRNYLLSFNHPIGRFKAVFFGALGYTSYQWEQLQRDLLQLGRSGRAVTVQQSSYGEKYEVRGILVGPSGRRAEVVTIWIVRTGETSPQLVTAFPGE